MTMPPAAGILQRAGRDFETFHPLFGSIRQQQLVLATRL